MLRTFTLLILCFAIGTMVNETFAAVTVYTNKASWQAAAGPYTTITFQELPPTTYIDEQYAHLGVHFTDGSDQVYASNLFPNDGVGLNGAFDETTLEFDAPMTTIAMDFPGIASIKLFANDQLIYTSPLMGGGGVGFFAGLISTEPFDSVQLYDPFGTGFFADDVHSGPPIPAPGALALLGVSALLGSRRRREA